MQFFSNPNPKFAISVFLTAFSCASLSYSAMDPRFELDPKTISNFGTSKKTATKKEGRTISDDFTPAFYRQSSTTADKPSTSNSFTLESPGSLLTDQEINARIQNIWERIVPVTQNRFKPVTVESSTFSLTLDPHRYPSFNAMNGGRIILDQAGTIPPLIKSLIHEKDPSLRIVSESVSNPRKFMSAMLEAARFYSVEENFTMDFGVDPILSVHADFKIERTPDSLARQDIVLMNSGLGATQPALVDFLSKEGVSLYEPFASVKQYTPRNSRQIQQILGKKQVEILDSILHVLSVPFERGRRLELFTSDSSGISLSVNAERYFERGGQRFVITRFDGDPVNYTLFRILETKGIKVVILEAQDDFRKMSEKILSRMKIKNTFARHNLLQDSRSSNCSVQMSGFSIDDSSLPGGGLFMTNLSMNNVISELLMENGYSINSR